jgi:diguanylate cyclase (GGDEF)-like protein
MTRKGSGSRQSGRKILLVDDSEEVLDANRLLLEREGHTVFTATNGFDGLKILQETDIELLVVDYFMPGMTGEDVVRELRRFNRSVQVILATGYSSERPPREMLSRLDIQGYCDKSAGPEHFLLWVDVGLKMANQVRTLEMSRQGLRYILDVTPDLHRIQPLGDLLQGILFQVAGLLGAVHSFVAVPGRNDVLHPAEDSSTDSFIAIMEEERDLVIEAAIGKYAGQKRLRSVVRGEMLANLKESLAGGKVSHADSMLFVPLRIGETSLGVICLEQVPELNDDNREVLRVFANQASVAVQNAQLYQAAALDPLSGVYTKKFWQQLAMRELRTCFRFQTPYSIVILDMDRFKSINDTCGHLMGDRALEEVGKILRTHMRASDAAGRFGGDEFVVVLPRTDAEGAAIFCDRILREFENHSWNGSEAVPLRATLGSASLPAHPYEQSRLPRPIQHDWFQQILRTVFENADKAVYSGKSDGGGRHVAGASPSWPPPPPPRTGTEADDGDSTFVLLR